LSPFASTVSPARDKPVPEEETGTVEIAVTVAAAADIVVEAAPLATR
jgi:hypothetical protein